MFPGRRLTRWCQLVPRVMMMKNGRALIATAKTAKKTNSNNNNDGPATDLETTHSMSLVPTLEAKDTLIIVVDADASSNGDIGFVFIKVPTKAAGEEKMIFDVKTKKLHEEIRSGKKLLATKREAGERTQEMEDAVRNSLLFTVRNRTILERGTDCSCLVFELSGKDRKSGVYGRDKLLELVKKQVYEEVCSKLDETALRMTNEMKAKNFVSETQKFNQEKKDELFERMFHILYSETSVIDYISQSSSFTEILKSKVLPSSIISPILGALSSSSKNKKKELLQGGSEEEDLLPKMTVPKKVLMKQLSDSVDHVKEEMRKRREEKILQLQQLKEERERQQQQKQKQQPKLMKAKTQTGDSFVSSSSSSKNNNRHDDPQQQQQYYSSASSTPLRNRQNQQQQQDNISSSSTTMMTQQQLKELYDFSDDDDDDVNGTNQQHSIEMMVNGKKRILGAYGGVRKEKMMKKYVIDKLISSLSTTTPSNNNNNMQQHHQNSSFALLNSRDRMLQLIRNSEKKKQDRIQEEAQLKKDIAFMNEIDELLDRTEIYDDFYRDDDDDDDDNNENNDIDHRDHHQQMMNVVSEEDDIKMSSHQNHQNSKADPDIIDDDEDDDDNFSGIVNIDQQEIMRKPAPPAPLPEDERLCRLQQQLLNQMIIKICNEKISKQCASEIGEAERKLL